VSTHDYEELKDIVKEWPDFFERPFGDPRISEGALGKLYRDINNEKAMTLFLKNEFKNSIKLDYTLDINILNQAKNPEIMHNYLKIIHKSIVAPMEKSIKRILA
jgi:hypothetical protein